MPSFNTYVSHQLGKDEATSRMKGFLQKVREKYQDQVSDLQESWEGDTLTYGFKTYGFKISGNLTVDDDKIQMSGKLPIAAMAFRGKIEESIKSELEKVLS